MGLRGQYTSVQHRLSLPALRCDLGSGAGPGRGVVGVSGVPSLHPPVRPAECNSAIQQVENLRYGCPIPLPRTVSDWRCYDEA